MRGQNDFKSYVTYLYIKTNIFYQNLILKSMAIDFKINGVCKVKYLYFLKIII